MGYFDNLDNKFSNKYEKIFKLKKPYKYDFLLIDWWWFKFNVISLSFDTHQESLNFI
jgi:hypothetical protein